MKLRRFLPHVAYNMLSTCLEELSQFKKYKQIILELNESGKLSEIGFKVDPNADLYLGIDLNPELLLYSETSQESVELKLVSEKMNKYNDFLTKEGILDSIKVDYERIKNEEFYGYVLQIGFAFKKYKRRDLIFAISYFSAMFALVILAGIAIVS
jgi:hypothetical protein